MRNSSSRTFPKTRMKAGERRSQLVRAAIDTFARHGFGGTRTKDIATAAGVSEGIIFQHFATKEDLYRAILDSKEDKRAVENLLRQLTSCAKSRDDAGLFRHIAEHVVGSFREDPAFHRLLMFAMLEGHVVAELFRERYGSRVKRLMKRYITLRQKEGAFRNCEPELAMIFAVGTIVHFAMGKYAMRMKAPADDGPVLQELVSFLMGGLGSDRQALMSNHRVLAEQKDVTATAKH